MQSPTQLKTDDTFHFLNDSAWDSGMLLIDVSSAYVICGAGALVGAGVLRLADSLEPQAAAAMRICRWGLTFLGVSLIAFIAQGIVPLPILQCLIISGTLVSIVTASWGIGLLAGETVSARAMIALIYVMAVCPLAGLMLGAHGLAFVIALGLVFTSFLLLYLTRQFLLDPPNAAARVLGVAIALLALSSVLRLGWTLEYEGPPLPHMMHVPVYAQSVIAVFYGVLPALVATMVLLLVNSRLRTLLTLQANTDELTGVSTRRSLHEMAPAHIRLSQRNQLQTAVLMLDLDHFKSINDRFGHATGDAVLQATTKLWRASLRPDSLLARFGGEEFVALIPVQDLEAGQRVAERMCSAIADAPWDTLTPAGVGVTTSVGLTLMLHGESLDSAMQRADKALYQAKSAGRNRVQVSQLLETLDG